MWKISSRINKGHMISKSRFLFFLKKKFKYYNISIRKFIINYYCTR